MSDEDIVYPENFEDITIKEERINVTDEEVQHFTDWKLFRNLSCKDSSLSSNEDDKPLYYQKCLVQMNNTAVQTEEPQVPTKVDAVQQAQLPCNNCKMVNQVTTGTQTEESHQQSSSPEQSSSITSSLRSCLTHSRGMCTTPGSLQVMPYQGLPLVPPQGFEMVHQPAMYSPYDVHSPVMFAGNHSPIYSLYVSYCTTHGELYVSVDPAFHTT